MTNLSYFLSGVLVTLAVPIIFVLIRQWLRNPKHHIFTKRIVDGNHHNIKPGDSILMLNGGMITNVHGTKEKNVYVTFKEGSGGGSVTNCSHITINPTN